MKSAGKFVTRQSSLCTLSWTLSRISFAQGAYHVRPGRGAKGPGRRAVILPFLGGRDTHNFDGVADHAFRGSWDVSPQ